MAQGSAEELQQEQHGTQDQQTMHYGAIVTPLFSFGSTGQGRGGMAYLEGDKLLFPAGVHIATYRTHNEDMHLTPLADKVHCSRALVISNNRKYVAVVEEVEGSAGQVVGVYAISTGKRVRQLTLEDPSAGVTPPSRVSSLSFSGSSKLLAVQFGEPEHTLVIYRWYLGKIVAVLRHEWPVLETVFSPVDDTLLVSVGASSVILHKLVDGDAAATKSFPIATADETRGAFTSVAWLMGGLLALATLRGRVQINMDQEVKGVLSPDTEDSLTCIVPKGRGFIAAGRKGVLYFYDPVEVSAKKGGSTELYSLTRALDVRVVGRGVAEVAVSPAEDAVCVMTTAGEMLTCSLAVVTEREEKDLESLLGRGWGLTGDAEHEPFRLVGGGVGGQRIVGLDATTQQPLMAVVTANNVVRVINYQTRRPVVVRQLVDDVLCAALHPSGTMLLLGLHDKLVLYSIALDDLQEVADFPVKKCHLVRYSPGGSKFAAVGRTNTIVVHHAYRHNQLALLKGHVSAVTDMSFSPDERLLCSTGAGGAVYFWDLGTGARLADAEYVDKRCIYAATAFAENAAQRGSMAAACSAVVRTHDGRLQHVQEGKVEFEVQGPQGGDASCLTLLGGDRVLLATDMRGRLVSYQWPASFPAPPGMDRFLTPHSCQLHSGFQPISHMVAFAERGLLLTASPDGCVMLSALVLVLGGALLGSAPIERGAGGIGTVSTTTLGLGGVDLTPTVLVPVEKLASSVHRLVDLAGMLGTIKSDAEYAAFRTAQALRETVSRLESDLATVRSQLARKDEEIAVLRETSGEKEKEIVKTLENAHLAAAEELELLYDKRLELEAEKARVAQAKADDRYFQLEEQMKRMAAAHQAEIQAINDRHARTLIRAQQQLAEAQKTHEETQEFWAEYADQAEVDYDVAEERLNSRLAAAAAAADQREGVLRAELNLLKRASLRLKGEKALDAKRLEKLLKDNHKLQDSLDESQETISKLQREVNEREAVLADNYDTLQVLRRKMQDLEKHKYVLAYKADAYQSELEPRKAEVRALQEDIEHYQSEMIERLAQANSQSRALEEKDRYAKSLKTELAAAKLRIAHQESLLRMFSADVASVWNASDERGSSGVGQKSARQKGMEELYQKYVTSGASNVRSTSQVEAELTRHLHMSELRTQLVTHRLDAEVRQSKSDRHVMVQHNVQLLRELQVAVQDNRELGRRLAATSTALRELSTRHRLLEERMKNIGLHTEALTQDATAAQPSTSGDDAQPARDASAGGGGAEQGTEGAAAGARRPASAWGRPTGTAGGGGGGVNSRRPVSAGPGTYTYRTAGGPPGYGSLHRGSAARALHELVAVERDHISVLLTELGKSAMAVEHQQKQLQQLQSTLQATLTAGLDISGGGGAGGGGPAVHESVQQAEEGTAEVEEQLIEGEGGEGNHQGGVARARQVQPDPVGGSPGAAALHVAEVLAAARASLGSGSPGATAAGPAGSGRRRPASAMPASHHRASLQLGSPRRTGASNHQQPPPKHTDTFTATGTAYSSVALLNSSGPVAFSTPTKRRPTTAGGMGIRAYISSNIKAWRDT